MRTPLSVRPLLALLGLSLALASITYAGSFSADFSSMPGGATVYGSANVDGTQLVLTPAAVNQQGSFVIDDLDPGSRISSFVATFSLHMGNGTATPGDGACFVFGTDVPNASFDEEGGGTTGLVITFDAYDNSLGDDTEGPEFRIKYGGALVARRKITNQFRTGTGYVPVVVRYTSAGTLTLVYNNTVMFTNLFVFSPEGTGARFGFGARCGGGADQEQFIDDLNITTSTINSAGFYIKGQVTPYPPVDLSGASSFLVQFQDQGAVADPNSVTMSFNGAAVAPAVSKPAAITTISYAPHGALLPSSVNHMAINFSLSGNPTTLLYDFAVTNAPLWSLAPSSRVYLPPDTDLVSGSTPLCRSIALSPLTNHLYVLSRTNNPSLNGISVNVLDATTGADLYPLNTNGIISAGTITVLGVTTADDGAIYVCNVSTTNSIVIYRWANDNPSTTLSIVYSSTFPGNPSNTRWGDSLAARGSGATTQLILDSGFVTNAVILTATDSSATSFTAQSFIHTYVSLSGNAIGRSIQFGPTNTYLIKKRSTGTTPPVAGRTFQFNSYDIGTGTTTPLLVVSDYYPQVGPVTFDLTRGLAAGIMFVTNTALPDRLIVYDVSNLASPLQIAQYDFPVTKQKNSNFIGQTVFGSDKIFAVDGNNGIIAVPITPPTIPSLKIVQTGGSAVLSWTNFVPGFVLQSTTSLLTPSWGPVGQPVVEAGPLNIVTDTPSVPTFYRLVK